MGYRIQFVTKDWDNVVKNLSKGMLTAKQKIVLEMADALLVVSRQEVPHLEGTLQSSGHTFYDGGEDVAVTAYNTVYASYQHEGVRRDGTHVVHNWTGGRKKKYLEDPLKMNFDKWLQIAQKGLGQVISKA